MKKRISITLLLCSILFSIHAQRLETYKLYNKKGKEIDFDKLVKAAKKADVVLFGELHNNPICHWLQLQLTKAVSAEKTVTLGAEMFEVDDQLILNEYLSGIIKEKHLKKEAKIWDNYATDYAPLVNYAKERELKFIATNVPRRYASFVASNGSEKLQGFEKDVKKMMAPLPLLFDKTTPGYDELLNMKMGHGMDMNPEFFTKAQALKDATMAHFILQNRKGSQVFMHFNGDFHSKNYGGIYWYLKEKKSGLDVLVISTEESAVLNWSTDYEGRADFMLVIPSDMTKTY